MLRTSQRLRHVSAEGSMILLCAKTTNYLTGKYFNYLMPTLSQFFLKTQSEMLAFMPFSPQLTCFFLKKEIEMGWTLKLVSHFTSGLHIIQLQHLCPQTDYTGQLQFAWRYIYSTVCSVFLSNFYSSYGSLMERIDLPVFANAIWFHYKNRASKSKRLQFKSRQCCYVTNLEQVSFFFSESQFSGVFRIVINQDNFLKYLAQGLS